MAVLRVLWAAGGVFKVVSRYEGKAEEDFVTGLDLLWRQAIVGFQRRGRGNELYRVVPRRATAFCIYARVG